MTLKRLRDLIRKQAGIKGHDTEIGWIDAIINSRLVAMTARHQYPEMLLVDQSIVAVGVNNPVFPLPTNLQHFLEDSIRYSVDGDLEDSYPLQRSDSTPGSADSPPFRFYRAGANITMWPQQIGATDRIWLNYYKRPTVLVADADVFPIESLIEVIRLETVSVVARGVNTKEALLAKDDVIQAYADSRAALE